jgi:hypothetical protein
MARAQVTGNQGRIGALLPSAGYGEIRSHSSAIEREN